MRFRSSTSSDIPFFLLPSLSVDYCTAEWGHSDGRWALCQLTPFLYGRFLLMLGLQKNSKSDSVRDQQQGHDKSWKEVGRSQLSRQQPGVIGLVKRIKEVGCSPDVE